MNKNGLVQGENSQQPIKKYGNINTVYEGISNQ